MKQKSIMIQGTASCVGKSILATALCRIFTMEGFQVNPFKAQNMSLNSYITAEGGEIGRAQVVQAEAAKKLPSIKMNPILLKPSSDKKSQVIVNGKVFAVMDAKAYYTYKPCFIPSIMESYSSLLEESDIVVLEGAGSPAEINLKENDIVNMGMAKLAKSPVLLVGDIDKGGVFASLVGTLQLLSEEEKAMVKGIIINKFRGDVALLNPGLIEIEKITGVPVLGVVPMLDISIEEEDSEADFDKFCNNENYNLDIAVIKLPFISNFTDLNALALEPMTKVHFVEIGEDLGSPDIIILPGTKSTVNALTLLKMSGMDKKIQQAVQKGCFVFGICGGYQIMGKTLQDKAHIESNINDIEGLNLVAVNTVFEKEKSTVLSQGIEGIFGEKIEGYEIHMGREEIDFSNCNPFIKKIEGGFDGAMSIGKRAIGTYFHGIFDNGNFVRNYLNFVRQELGKEVYNGSITEYKKYKEEQYDKLAQAVKKSIDMKKIYEIVENGL